MQMQQIYLSKRKLRERPIWSRELRHFSQYLESKHFTVFTDHKPLTYALQTKTDTHSPTERRQIDYILQDTSDIIRISSISNTLSRLPVCSLSSPVDIGLATLTTQQPALSPRDITSGSLFLASTCGEILLHSSAQVCIAQKI